MAKNGRYRIIATLLSVVVVTFGVTALALPAAQASACPSVDPGTGAVTGPAPGPGVDWSGCDLSGASMGFVDFTGSNLSGANLTGASFFGSTLVNVDLSGATLDGASLSNAGLSGATFAGATLINADLSFSGPSPNANFTGADLTGANASYSVLASVNFSNVVMVNASFAQTTLTGSNLGGANVSGTDLTGATLAGVSSGGVMGDATTQLPTSWQIVNGYLIGPSADLSSAVLSNVNLAGANLAGANLVSADLSGADLSTADLSGADLASANLSHANASNADLTNATSKNYYPPADFTYADLSGAHLDGTRFYGVDLSYADLSGSSVPTGAFWAFGTLLNHANVNGASFYGLSVDETSGSDIQGTPAATGNYWSIANGYFLGNGAVLPWGADLSHLDLTGVNLHDMQTPAAHFEGSNLTDARLGGNGDYSYANFTNAILDDATIFTDMSTTTLDGATGCGISTHPTETVWPTGYFVDAAGCLKYDSTAPTASPTQSPAANGNGWNDTDVTVTWNWSDNTGGSGIDPSQCTTSSTSTGEGTIVLHATCSDAVGNTGTADYTVKVDKTAPTLNPSVSPNPAPLGGAATATPNAADEINGSGLASASCGTSVTSAVGSFSVNCTATDIAGNVTNASASYTVTNAFLGFQSPLPKAKFVKTVASIPVKFSVGAISGTPKSTTATVRVGIGTQGDATKVTYGGQLATASCAYSTSISAYQCSLKRPSVVVGTTYYLTVFQQVPGSSTWWAMPNRTGVINRNVEPISFK